MRVHRSDGLWRLSLASTRKHVPSWRALIPRRCPISPPGTWSPLCPPQRDAGRVSRCFPPPIWKRCSGCMGCDVDRAALDIRHTGAGLVSVPGAQRSSHPTPLATGVLCLLVLLVSRQPPLHSQRGRPTAHGSCAGSPCETEGPPERGQTGEKISETPV